MTSSGSPFPTASGARILSLGGYQPGNVVTNDDLAAQVDTSDEWIRSRVGIVSRRFAGPGETVTDMAFEAGAKALAGSGLSPGDIDLVIVATCSTEASIPNVSAVVAHRVCSCFRSNPSRRLSRALARVTVSRHAVTDSSVASAVTNWANSGRALARSWAPPRKLSQNWSSVSSIESGMASRVVAIIMRSLLTPSAVRTRCP